jgi:hypothetical protein
MITYFSRTMILFAAVASLTAVLTPSPAHAVLSHRYTFNGNANDSVGTAHGAVVDAGVQTHQYLNGMLLLTGNTGQPSNAISEDAYVDLPNGIVTAAANAGTSGAISFEWWATVAAQRTWQRLGDFGTSNNGEDTADGGGMVDYMMVTPNSGRFNNGLEMTSHISTGAEPSAGIQGPFPIGFERHVIAAYDKNDTNGGTNPGGTMRLYLQGVQVATGAIPEIFDPNVISDNNNWIGRSQWPDPAFDGIVNEFSIYSHAVTAAEASANFAAGPMGGTTLPAATINRATGALTLTSPSATLRVIGYTVTSATGAIQEANWTPIAGRLDAPSNGGNGSFDANDNWAAGLISPASPAVLEEAMQFDSVGDDGAPLTGTPLNLGNVWRKNVFEDVQVTLQVQLTGGAIVDLPAGVTFTGNGGAPFGRSDLNFDGTLTAVDWAAFASHHLQDLSTMTVAQAAALGDLNRDFANDYDDFLLFKADYDSANGPGALTALMAAPEPSSAVLLLVGGCAASGLRRSKGGRRAAVVRAGSGMQSRGPSSCLLATALLAVVGLVNLPSRANAQVVATTTGALTGALTGNTFNYALQGGGNALVLGVYTDVGGGNIASNVTFASAPATGIVSNDRVNVMYMFNPAASGAITFDLSAINAASNSIPYFLYELAGVNTTAPVDTGMGGTIDTTVPNQFVINFIGANNTDGTGTVPSTTSILEKAGASNGNGQIGGGALVSGFAQGLITGAAGTKDVGWTFNAGGGGAGFASGSASIGLSAASPTIGLTLIVNKTSGQIRIRNNTAAAVSFDYYLIESDGNALDSAGWSSLDDQNVDASLPADFNNTGGVNGADLTVWRSSFGVNAGADAEGDGDSDGQDFLAWQRDLGKAPGPADGWIEAGGSNASQLGELFLDGATVLGPGQEVSLGAAYNETVFGAADGDLIFRASTGDSDALLAGNVTYVAAAFGAAANVPEPGSAAICLAALGIVGWKRRQGY